MTATSPLANGNTTADTEGLQALIDKAASMNEDDFTPETWAEYAKAIEDARTLLEGTPDSEAVEQAKIAINKAYAALRFTETEVPEPEPGEPNFDALNAAIKAAEALTKSDYTADSWAVVEAALADAKTALKSDSQDEVDAAAEALNAAVAALEKAEEPGPVPGEEVDTSDLQAAID